MVVYHYVFLTKYVLINKYYIKRLVYSVFEVAIRVYVEIGFHTIGL